jgi:predicted DNA-binding WGR domain protein
MWDTIGSSRLYYTGNGSDKFYEVEVQIDDAYRPGGNTPRFRVRARYGRRGANSTWVIKDAWQALDRAVSSATAVLQGKYRKGYTAHIDGRTSVCNIDSFRNECRTRFSNEYDNASPRPPAAVETDAAAIEQRRALQAERERVRRERLREQALSNPEYEDFAPRVIDFDGVD